MKNKTIIVVAICLIIIGFLLLAIKSTTKSSNLHLQLKEFYEQLDTNTNKLSHSTLTLYGFVKEGSLVKKGIEADFIIYNKDLELAVHANGKHLLPDTFKEGAQVSVTGKYIHDKKIFIADSVLAKCASRYEKTME